MQFNIPCRGEYSFLQDCKTCCTQVFGRSCAWTAWQVHLLRFQIHTFSNICPAKHLNRINVRGGNTLNCLKWKVTFFCEFKLLFHLVQFVKCSQIFLDLNSWRLYLSTGKEKLNSIPMFTSFIKKWNQGDARAKFFLCKSNPIAFNHSPRHSNSHC